MSSNRLHNANVCTTWVWSTGSNVHVAKDLEWFVEYHPFQSHIHDFAGGQSEVAGVGTVEIPVKVDPSTHGTSTHRILRLHNVVHVPKYLCNILGGPAAGDYDGVNMGPGPYGKVVDHDNRPLALLTHARMIELLLSEYPAGPKDNPAPFRSGVAYMLNAIWPPAERQRWERWAASGLPTCSEARGYTPEEKEWLKRNWGSEYKFLKTHGLDIHNEEDREEGRRIVRATMSPDGDSGSEAEVTVPSDSGPSQFPQREGPRVECLSAFGIVP
ncbi:hypothetical protein V8F20_005301 [Naviculisporaceae sp. PSN 640]